MKAKELIEDGAIGDVRIIRAMSPFSDYGLPSDHWLNDPGEGDCFLDWGSHACDAFRWFTESDATRVYADYANFSAMDARWPTALVQIRMASGAICQALLSYEIPEPGLGSGSNNQYLIIGGRGMIEWDLDTCRPARDGPLGDGAGAAVVDQGVGSAGAAAHRQHGAPGAVVHRGAHGRVRATRERPTDERPSRWSRPRRCPRRRDARSTCRCPAEGGGTGRPGTRSERPLADVPSRAATMARDAPSALMAVPGRDAASASRAQCRACSCQ